MTQPVIHTYVATPLREDALTLPSKRATVSKIIEMYWDLSGDERNEIGLFEVYDWYEQEGWKWVKER
jgi:hypothetical protein